MNESKDMFGEDSEDDALFLEVKLEDDKKGEKKKSQYDTAALMEMINLERSETSETSAKRRRKLTDIFDSISEDEKVQSKSPLPDSVRKDVSVTSNRSVANDSVISNRRHSGEKSNSLEQSKSDG